MRYRLFEAAMVTAALIVATLVWSPAAALPGLHSDGRSAYVAITPCRLVDTRDGSMRGVIGVSTIRVQATGRCGVPTTASAVALSLTVTDAGTDGFATVTPAGVQSPTSTINWSRGETRAASSVVLLSASGALDVYVSSTLGTVGVVVDVTGAWSLVNGPVSGGRLVSLAPRRVLDTRVRGGPVGAGRVVTLDRATLGIPSSAVAVAGTLTTSDASGPGYLTAYPNGAVPPLASNVNTDQAGQTRAAGIIVALGTRGLSLLAGAASADIVLDVSGYVTGPKEPASTEGLLIAIPPRRVLDTRMNPSPLTRRATVGIGKPFDGAAVGGVIATITVTDAPLPGYAAIASPDALESGSPTSVLNWSRATAVAAMTVQSVSRAAELSLVSSTAMSLIVDVTGYLLTANAPDGPELLLPGSTTLTTGSIDDRGAAGLVNGHPLALLSQVYSGNVLAAGGGVSIVATEVLGTRPAFVPGDPRDFPECGPEPLCIVVSRGYWESPLRGGLDANRAMISHEWAHVLSTRWQIWVDDVTLAAWWPRHDAVNEECLADAVGAMALARSGLPGNETPSYVVHYMCDAYWAAMYGADAVAGMRTEASALASDLLAWAEGWGAVHGR